MGAMGQRAQRLNEPRRVLEIQGRQRRGTYSSEVPAARFLPNKNQAIRVVSARELSIWENLMHGFVGGAQLAS